MASSARSFLSGPKLADDYVLVGAIAGAFGVQGEVKLRSFTGDEVAKWSPVVK